jgi:ribosomal protein S11
MANPTKLVVDCSTGITETIELTDAEVAQMQADAETYAAQKAAEDAAKEEAEAKKTSGKAKLKALGLSDAEIEALVG